MTNGSGYHMTKRKGFSYKDSKRPHVALSNQWDNLSFEQKQEYGLNFQNYVTMMRKRNESKL